MFISDVTTIENQVRLFLQRCSIRVQSLIADLYSIATVLFILCALAVSAVVGFLIEHIKAGSGEFVGSSAGPFKGRMALNMPIAIAKTLSLKARAIMRQRPN